MDLSGLGTLNKLPREIRDEIYRYLVKGRCFLYQPYCKAITAQRKRKPSIKNFRFPILQVSKAIHDEATSIFYSESVFRDYVDMFSYIALLPAHVTNRMMKITFTIDFDYLHSEWIDLGSRGIEGTLLEKFTGLGVLRKTLFLEFKLADLDIYGVLSDHLLKKLKSFVGFRTIIMSLGPRSDLNSKRKKRIEFEGITQALKGEMVPTMGPATISYVGLNTYLEFHPLEHMRANPGAQTEMMQMEMDKLQSGGDRLEEGD